MSEVTASYSSLNDRELMEALINRIDIIVAVLLAAAAITLAGLFCYIIYRAIMKFI